MEHKITIEILLKSDLFNSKEKEPTFKEFNVDPRIISDLMESLLKNLKPEVPKEKVKTKSKKEAKK